jgi:hypothetical protein
MDSWGGLGVGIGGILAAVLGLGVYALAKKDKTMTALEKALGGVVVLLWQRVSESEEAIEKLRKERDARPTREQLNAAEQDMLHQTDELNMTRRKVEELTKQRDELSGQLDRCMKGSGRKRRAA